MIKYYNTLNQKNSFLLVNRSLLKILFIGLISFCLSSDLYALPIKTQILNPKKQAIGQALIYIDYVELLSIDGTPKGRLGFVNSKGGFKMFVVRDGGKHDLVGHAANKRLYNKEGKLVGHYDWTSFWSYVYAVDGTKLGQAKCIAFRGICAAGVASYLTGLLD